MEQCIGHLYIPVKRKVREVSRLAVRYITRLVKTISQNYWDFVHLPVCWKLENNASETGFVSVPKRKGEDTYSVGSHRNS
jgi:hypothetical protein